MELTDTKYKQTEVGFIPIDWDFVQLKEKIKVSRGGSPRPIQAYLTKNPNGINWIKIGDTSSNSKYITSAKEKIIEEGVMNSREVKIGDFLLSNSMSFGRPYILKINGCIHDGWLVLQNYHEEFDKEYLYYLLSSNYILNQYKSKAAGSSVLNLNKELVSSVHLIAPTLEEQKSIATALTDIDELISGLEKLISKKKDIKQGAMQQLLTPPHKGGKRLPGFSGEWEKKQLKSCLIYEQPSKYIVQNSDYEGQSQTPVLTAGKSFLLGYTDEDFGIYDNLPVIIFDDFTTSSQFVNFNFKVKSSAMKMLKPVDNCVDIKFIFSLMNLINFSLGDEHKRRWIAEYSEQIIYVPKIDEQRAISSMIDDMTFELDELISKRKKYQAIKQGMMQELLTGKTRLV